MVGQFHRSAHGLRLSAGDGQSQTDAAALGYETLRTGFEDALRKTCAVVEDAEGPAAGADDDGPGAMGSRRC